MIVLANEHNGYSLSLSLVLACSLQSTMPKLLHIAWFRAFVIAGSTAKASLWSWSYVKFQAFE